MKIKKLYLDTNVVLDFLDKEREKHIFANDLIRYCTLNGIELHVSEDILSTIFYINKNKEQTLKFFDVILEDWTVLSFGKAVIQKSIYLSLENKLDFEDVLQCICAKENKCDILVTNDKNFYNCSIEVMTSEKLINMLALL